MSDGLFDDDEDGAPVKEVAAPPVVTAVPRASVPGAMMSPPGPAPRGARDETAASKALVDDELRRLSAIPVRDLLQAMFKARRDTLLRGALFFIVSFVLFAFISNEMNDVPTINATNMMLEDLLLDEEFASPVRHLFCACLASINAAATLMYGDDHDDVQTYKKNFFDVMTPGDFWEWALGPMAQALYPEAATLEQEQYVNGMNRRVGPVRIRQVRVRPDSCAQLRYTTLVATHIDPLGSDTIKQLGRYDTLDRTCWDGYTAKSEDRSPMIRPRANYTWRSDLDPLEGLFGQGVGSYGTGGFVVDLPALNRSESLRLLAQLAQDEWFDRGTRVVSVEFMLYNTETRLGLSCMLLFERGPTSNIVKSWRFNAMRMRAYDGGLSLARAAAEVVFVLLWLRDCFGLVQSYRLFGLRMFTRTGVNFEVVVAVAQLAYIALTIAFISASDSIDFDVNRETFRSYQAFGELYANVFTAAGVVGLVFFLKVFRFLGVSKRMQTVWLTLQRAATDLVAFMVGFFALMAGFAFLAFIMFGFLLSDFRSMAVSMSSLLRMALGDFNYSELSAARPQLAPLFFSLFIIVIFLLGLTVFVGIVSRYFDQVHDELKTADRWKDTTPTFEREMVQWIKLQVRLCIYGLQRDCCRSYCLATIAICCCARCQGQLCEACGCGARSPCGSAVDRYSGNKVQGRPQFAAGTSQSHVRINGLTVELSPRSRAATSEAVLGGLGGVMNPMPQARASVQGAVARTSIVGALQEVHTTVADREIETIDKLRQLRRARAFYSHADWCWVLAQRRTRLDLFVYFERVYEMEPNSDLLYVTEDALNLMLRKPSESFKSLRTAVPEAETLVRLFHAYKNVEVFGTLRPHLIPEQVYLRCNGDKARFDVSILSDLGAWSPYIVWVFRGFVTPKDMLEAHNDHIPALRGENSAATQYLQKVNEEAEREASSAMASEDDERAEEQVADFGEPALMVFDRQCVLQRRMLLRQIVLVDLPNSDECRLNVVFSARGCSNLEELMAGGLEVTLRLRFASKERRAAFRAELLTVAFVAHAAASEDDVIGGSHG